jgi:ABC-type transporter Mla subunit MlaD
VTDDPRTRKLIGLAVITFVVGGYLLLFLKIPQKLLDYQGRTVDAVFANTELMGAELAGQDVRVHGIQVGYVTGIHLNPGARSTTLDLNISGGPPLHANATVALRWRNVLGSSYYVDVDPGTPGAGPLRSSTVPESRTSSQVELEDLVNVVQGGARAGLLTTLAQLPRAFQNPRYPAATLSALAGASPSMATGFGAAQGEQAGDLRRMVILTGRAIQALDAPRQGLRTFVDGAAQSLTTMGNDADAIRTMIARAASVQPTMRSTLAALNTTLGVADPLIARLNGPARSVAPTAVALRPMLRTAGTLLGEARPMMRSLRPAVTSLRGAAAEAGPLLTGLTPSVQRLGNQILPNLAQVSPETQHSTYEMIGPAFAGLDGDFARFDSQGYFGMLDAQVSENSLDSLPCRTYIFDPTNPRIADCDALVKLLGNLMNGKGTK